MNKIVTYYRVSTTRQGKSGLGLEAQEHETNQYITRVGGGIVESYTDVESGKKNNRPELEKALRKCRLTGAILVIAKLDRLSR
ncbi:MAG: recombinase family protein [Arenicella sp.]|nr:recombinase family protein [Arenicella sp.]